MNILPLNSESIIVKSKIYKETKELIKNTIISKANELKIDSPWEYPLDNVPIKVIEQLKECFQKKGFEVSCMKEITITQVILSSDLKELSNKTATTTREWFRIQLKPNNSTESTSDAKPPRGWEKKCLAEHVQRDISYWLNKKYNTLSKKVEMIIQANSTYKEIKFDALAVPKVLVGWLVEDLKKQNYMASESVGETKDSLYTTTPYHYLVCKIPDSLISPHHRNDIFYSKL